MQHHATNSENELSGKQVLAIPHLVSPTVYRWMDDPAFREEYDRQRDAVAGFARSGMRTLMLKALSVQAERFDSDDTRERARAAKAIMDYDAKTAPKHESQKLLNRLHSLIYSTDNRVLDQPTINSELEQYLNSHERH